MSTFICNGEQAIAQAAVDAKIQLATGYPGSPGGGIIDILQKLAPNFKVHWSGNEKIALEKGIGVAINKGKALICVKSVGLNAMLDPLTVVNLTPFTGALVIINGDDPGGYGSQNDQDSRALARFLNLPWFEPADPQQGYLLTRMAFQLSASHGLPVFIRITRSYGSTSSIISPEAPLFNILPYDLSRLIQPAFVPYPDNAVAKTHELAARMKNLDKNLERLNLDQVFSKGRSHGIIVCGHLIEKIQQVVDRKDLVEHCDLLFLQTIHPLNDDMIKSFLSSLTTVSVFEENTSIIGPAVMQIAAECGLKIQWHLEATPGEFFKSNFYDILHKRYQGIKFRADYKKGNERPNHKRQCAQSRYQEVLDLLDECAIELKQKFYYYADPGCLVAFPERLYAKYAMGGSVASVLGANIISTDGLNIALIGDSGFYHSTIPSICDAAALGSKMPMILLNNNGALTTGGQPHPGSVSSPHKKPVLDTEEIAKSCGVELFVRLHIDQPKEKILSTLISFLEAEKLRLLEIKFTE